MDFSVLGGQCRYSSIIGRAIIHSEEEGMSEEYPRVNLEENSHLEVQKRGKN